MSAVERSPRWRGRAIFGIVLHIGVVTALLIGIKFAVIFFVDTNRPTSHWMVYESVEPVEPRYALGVDAPPIVFRTKAVRFHHVRMKWKDILYCADSEGKLKGQYKYIGIAPAHDWTRVGPAYLGYDQMPVTGDQNYKWMSGYWNWEGPLPKVPSTCYLLPQPLISPSISVEPKVVPVPPSSTFEMYAPGDE